MSTKILRLLPPPLDWKGPSEIICGLSGYPFYRTIEAAGHGYQAFLRKRSGHVEAVAVEDMKSPELNVSKEDEIRFSHKKHKKALEMGTDDPYEVMGLDNLRWRATEEDIRTQFRKLVLLYHPDKMEQSSKTEADDELFKRISKANDILIDQKKRRALDSQDDFDDSIPTGNEKGDFFAVFGPVFHRFSRWSTVQPCPLLGELEDEWGKIESFYEFWYSFKSWRDYSFEDEYNLDEAESREEKRWMERQNDRERKRHKKEEISNIFKLTETAERLDPRVKKRRQEAAEAKKAAKNNKGDEKKKAKIEAEKAAAVERERKVQEEKFKAEEEEKNRKEKASNSKAMATAKRKLRSLTNRYSEQNPGSGFGPTADEIDLLCSKCSLDTILAINTSLLANGPDAVDLFNQEMIKLSGKPSTPSSSPVVVKKADAPPAETKAADSKSDARPWTEEELSLLSKGLHRYPGGALNRWENIADMMGRTRSVKEIIAKTKDGKTVAKPQDLYQVDDAYTRFNKTLKKTEVVADPSVDPTLVDTPTQNGTPNGNHKDTTTKTETATSDSTVAVWSSDQQKALEAALAANPASKENRWDHIAAVVPGKTKKECIARYKHLVSKIKEKSK